MSICRCRCDESALQPCVPVGTTDTTVPSRRPCTAVSALRKAPVQACRVGGPSTGSGGYEASMLGGGVLVSCTTPESVGGGGGVVASVAVAASPASLCVVPGGVVEPPSSPA